MLSPAGAGRAKIDGDVGLNVAIGIVKRKGHRSGPGSGCSELEVAHVQEAR